MNALERSIEDARYILELEDDWDENGAVAVAPSTWNVATAFLQNLTLWAYKYRSLVLGALSISPLGNGGIDLYWENTFADLLLTIPVSGHLAHCYGQNARGEVFRGTMSLKDPFPDLILTWLKKRENS